MRRSQRLAEKKKKGIGQQKRQLLQDICHQEQDATHSHKKRTKTKTSVTKSQSSKVTGKKKKNIQKKKHKSSKKTHHHASSSIATQNNNNNNNKYVGLRYKSHRNDQQPWAIKSTKKIANLFCLYFR